MRCKACDNAMMESEITWRSTVERWEDLCKRCLSIVYESDDALVVPDYMLIEDIGETDDATL
jgi:hypothetical protein